VKRAFVVLCCLLPARLAIAACTAGDKSRLHTTEDSGNAVVLGGALTNAGLHLLAQQTCAKIRMQTTGAALRAAAALLEPVCAAVDAQNWGLAQERLRPLLAGIQTKSLIHDNAPAASLRKPGEPLTAAVAASTTSRVTARIRHPFPHACPEADQGSRPPARIRRRLPAASRRATESRAASEW
jgi:hypothetical protein